jgi:hypothetical protein
VPLYLSARNCCLLTVALAAAGCGDEAGSPLSANVQPGFGHNGVEYRAESALINFEVPIPSYWTQYDPNLYFTLRSPGISFSKNSVVADWYHQNYVWNFYLLRAYRTPPTSGEMALGIWGGSGAQELSGGFSFSPTVSRIEFKLRLFHDFEITCYNSGGDVLLERPVKGNIDHLGLWVGPIPAKVDHVQLAAPGIARCEWLARGGMLDDLEFWPERAPELACTPTVVRGGTVTCTITNATAVEVEEWEFVGETYANDPSLRIREPGPLTTWSGPGVEGGVVTAKVRVNGNPDTLTSSFAVTNRRDGWQWGPADWSYVQGGAPVCDSERPTNTAQLNIGWNRNAGVSAGGCFTGALHRWVLPDPIQNPNAGYTVAPVPSGPNRGRWYVTSASYRIDRVSNMNPHWLPSGPEFMLTGPQVAECIAAGINPPVRVNLYTFNRVCKGLDIDRFIAGIWGHEGYGFAGGSGHQGLGEGRAAQPGGDPAVAIEWQTRASEGHLRDIVRDAVDAVSIAIQAEAADNSGNVTGNWPGGVLWVWNPITRRYVERPIPPQ